MDDFTSKLWNAGLTFVFGLLGIFVKQKSDDLSEVTKNLQKTREEYVPRSEYNQHMGSHISRIDTLITKLEGRVDSLYTQGVDKK